MRVIVLTHYYPPEVGAPQARLRMLARELTRAGHQVTVHAPFPHYPHGTIPPRYRGRWTAAEGSDDGVRILRSAVYPAANRGFARRLLNHASFGASALLTSRRTGPQDVVIAESPPLFTAAAGVLYARAKGAGLVLNVADRWPASAVELGVLTDPRAIALAEALEAWCYRNAAAITVPTEGLTAALDDVPSASGKVSLAAPVVEAGRFAPAARASAGPLRVLYAGTVGLAQGLLTLVEAARLAGPDVVDVEIVGGGAELDLVVETVARERVGNVNVRGLVDHAEIPALYARADVGAVLLRDRPIFEGAVPTKLLEVMAAGRAVVLSASGESARLVERAQAGLVAAPESAEELARALVRLHEHRDETAALGERGRRFVEREHGLDRMREAWLEVLARAARSS